MMVMMQPPQLGHPQRSQLQLVVVVMGVVLVLVGVQEQQLALRPVHPVVAVAVVVPLLLFPLLQVVEMVAPCLGVVPPRRHHPPLPPLEA